MSKKPNSLKKGDWIVHTYYGIGQIKSIETRSIDNKKNKYYKVKAKNSTFFIPVERIDEERIRPVASDYKLRKAKKILKSPPNTLPDDHTERKKLLAETTSDSSLEVSAETIRDLTHRKSCDGLNDYEEKTLQNLEKLFVREWAIIQEISEEDALDRYQKFLLEHLPVEE